MLNCCLPQRPDPFLNGQSQHQTHFKCGIPYHCVLDDLADLEGIRFYNVSKIRAAEGGQVAS